jgi:Carboxypeptidase regulatory-like domain
VNRILPKLALSLLAVLFHSPSAFAQVDVSTATLKGTITDQSGAVIARATVSAIGVERGMRRQARTDADGDYQIPLLQPGRYELRVEAKDFQTHRAQNVTLTIGQIGVVDVQLLVGDLNNELTVTAAVPLIETECTQQANTIEQRQIENLPSVSRNFTDFVFTLPRGQHQCGDCAGRLPLWPPT